MSFMDNLADSFRMLILREDAVKRIANTGGLGGGILFYALMATVAYVFSLLIQFGFLGAFAGFLSPEEVAMSMADMVFSLILAPFQIIGSVIGLFIGVGITFLFAKLLGGNGLYTNLVKLYAFLGGAQSVVSLVVTPVALLFVFLIMAALAEPALLVLVIILAIVAIVALIVWQFALQIMVVSVIMRMSKGRAFLAIILPAIIIVFIMLIVVLFIVAVIGSLATL